MTTASELYTFTSLTVLSTLFSLFFIGLLYRKRSSPIIQKRGVEIVAAHGLWTAFRVVYHCIRFTSGDSLGCDFDVGTAVFDGAGALMFVFRASHLLGAYRFTNEVQHVQKGATTSVDETTSDASISKLSFYARYYRWSSMKLFTVFAVFLFFQSVPTILYYYSLNSAHALPLMGSACRDVWAKAWAPFYLFLLFIVVFMIYISVKLKAVEENLHYKTEMYGVVGVFVYGILAGSILPAFGQGWKEGFDWSFLLLFLGPSSVIQYFVLYRTVYYAYQLEKSVENRTMSTGFINSMASTGKTGNVSGTLSEVLGTPEYYALFSDFLAKEFALENILFLKDLDKFKANFTGGAEMFGSINEEASADWKKSLRKIYDKYISSEGMLTINLSSSTRKKIVKLLNRVEVTRETAVSPLNADRVTASFVYEVFDEASKEVYNLLSCDSFLRFKNTDAYKNMKKSQV